MLKSVELDPTSNSKLLENRSEKEKDLKERILYEDAPNHLIIKF